MAVSIEELESIIPVSPPIVNKKINPKTQSIGGSKLGLEPKIVANHLNTLIPVGIAIIIVTVVK